MHNDIHHAYARAVEADRLRAGRDHRPERPEPPPGRLRRSGARILARLARRLDREAARRALA